MFGFFEIFGKSNAVCGLFVCGFAFSLSVTAQNQEVNVTVNTSTPVAQLSSPVQSFNISIQNINGT